MSNIPNGAKQAVADAATAITAARRRVAAHLVAWLRHHPHTILAIAAAAVILAVAFGVIRG
jgi:hypothetical protein